MITSQELSAKLVVVAGMPRTGTTFLYHHFHRHPDVYVPARKESAYFSYHHDKSLEWFLSFYRRAGNEACAVDICPAYFFDDSAVDRIARFAPDARIILGVRRPTEWIYSLYGHYGDIYHVPPLRDFLDGFTIRREGKTYQITFGDQVIRKTIERYMDKFRRNLFLFDFDVLKDAPLCLLREIESFLGVSSYFNANNVVCEKVHARGTDRGRGITRILNSIPGFATLASRVVPMSALMAVRRRLEGPPSGRTRRESRRTADMDLSMEDRGYASAILREEDAYYCELFKEGPFVRGSKVLAHGRATTMNQDVSAGEM